MREKIYKKWRMEKYREKGEGKKIKEKWRKGESGKIWEWREVKGERITIRLINEQWWMEIMKRKKQPDTRKWIENMKEKNKKGKRKYRENLQKKRK